MKHENRKKKLFFFLLGGFEAGPAAVLLFEFVLFAHHCSGRALDIKIAPIAPIAPGELPLVLLLRTYYPVNQRSDHATLLFLIRARRRHLNALLSACRIFFAGRAPPLFALVTSKLGIAREKECTSKLHC